jgi:hypothetical protein
VPIAHDEDLDEANDYESGEESSPPAPAHTMVNMPMTTMASSMSMSSAVPNMVAPQMITPQLLQHM